MADPKVAELVFNEALRQIGWQEKTLDGLRGRAATLLSAASISTSFLGGLALSDRKADFSLASWVAIVSFILTMGVAALMLKPGRGYIFRSSGATLISGYLDAGLTIQQTHRYLAGYMDGWSSSNQQKLNRIHNLVEAGLVLLVISVVAWVYDLARYA